MPEIKNAIENVLDIIKQCEKSKLVSFSYQDSMISIQFCKEMKEDESRDEYGITKFINDIRMDHVADNMTVPNFLQEKKENLIENIITIVSPYVGTVEFSNQIKLNDGEIPVKKGDIICSIEAMKIYNDIKAPVTGTIIRILVNDCSLVEYDQPIFEVRVDKNE
jgi:acetyl-CoA carboxylase biotin carboxyl carrier protein